MNRKQVLALLGAVLLFLLYLSTLVFALLDHPASMNLLMASLFCTIVLPAVLYGYIAVLKHIKGRDAGDDTSGLK